MFIDMQSFDATVYALCLAFFMPIFFSFLAKALGGFTFEDNKNPRKFLANSSGLAERAHAIHANSFEILPFYIASILFSMYMIVPQIIINKFAWIFLFLRLLYAVAYLLDAHVLRSIVWVLSLACPLLLFKFCLQMF